MPFEPSIPPTPAATQHSRLHRRPPLTGIPLVLTAVAVTVAVTAAVFVLGMTAGCSPPTPEIVKPVRFGKRIVLTLLKPESYVLNSEMGEIFEVHHIWRKKPPGPQQDANLGIFIGGFALPHCKGEKYPGQAITPQRARGIGSRWRSCATSVPGQLAWERFQAAGRDLVVHLFILGKNKAEMEALKRIARTLELP